MDIQENKKKRQVINYQTISLQNKSMEQRTILILNLPINLNEYCVKQYFQQWGTVKHVMYDRETQDIAIVIFKQNDSVEKVLATKHILHGNILSVQAVDYEAQVDKDDYFRAQNLLKDVKHCQLLKVLRHCVTIDDQLELLQHELSLNSASLDHRKSLRDSFHQLFVKYFPESELQLFGSSIGGYGFEGTDIDVFLKLPEDYFAPGSRTINFTPDLKEVERGNVQIKLLTTEARLKVLLMILKENVPNCKDLMYYQSKICPLVKFQYIDHINSIPCDLSAFIQSGVVCGKLMRLYHDLDPRVTPLMISLRYWAERQNIIKPGKKLKTFTFALLVVFFLQSRDPPILPTVEQLKQLTDSKYFIGKWDCSFCDNVEKISKSTNCQTLEELVTEFFSFYAKFDFYNQVISVRLGKSFPRNVFLSEPANQGFRPRDISIQHFFELNRNTTFKCSKSFQKELSLKFKKSAQICSSFSRIRCRLDTNWGFGKLLEEIMFYNKCESALLSRTLRCNWKIQRLKEKECLASVWLEKVCSTIEKVLKVALYSECEVLYSVFHLECSSKKKSFFEDKIQQEQAEGIEWNKTNLSRNCDREKRAINDEFKSMEEHNLARDVNSFPDSIIGRVPDGTYPDNVLSVMECKVWDKIWLKRSYWKSVFMTQMSLGLEREVSQFIIYENGLKTYVKFDFIVTKMRTECPTVIMEIKPFTRSTVCKAGCILSLIYRLVQGCMRDTSHAQYS